MNHQRTITRRTLAALLGSAAAAAPALAAQPSAPATESSDAEAARLRNAEALNKVVVPGGTEPAFRFQA